jgi:O-antigen ligase
VETCLLAATGIAHSIGLTAVVAIVVIGAGLAILLLARGRRRPALFALAPLLLLVLLVSGPTAPAQADTASGVCRARRAARDPADDAGRVDRGCRRDR